MAIFGALGTARSGLVATGAALSVIGNNIANVNTVGFKGSRTEFADLLSAQGGGGSAGKIGLGDAHRQHQRVVHPGQHREHRPADRPRDRGQRLLRGRDRRRRRSSRAPATSGSTVDGRLVTIQGLPVQGFALNDLGARGRRADRHHGDRRQQPAARRRPRSQLKSNLRADADLITGGFDGTTFDTAYATLELHDLDQRLRFAGREAHPEPLLHAHRRQHLGLQRRRRRRRDRRHGRRPARSSAAARSPSTPTARSTADPDHARRST